MTTTVATLTEHEAEQRDALVGQLFEIGLHTAELFTIYLGDRLGLYRALAAADPATAAELAARTGTQERYAREWLEQQAVAGIVLVDDTRASPESRCYHLPPGHAEVLTDRDSLNYLAPLARAIAGLAGPLSALLHAFRHGGGVPYPAYGADVREGQADLNRTAFLSQLTQEWLPAVSEVHARLQADPPARVADIGCGTGWSSIALAHAYPKVRVDGFDADEASIALARASAQAARLADRAVFRVQDATDRALTGAYELVTVFEAIHDMAQPIEALRTIRRLLAPGGTALIADMRAAEVFTAPGDEVERFLYASSVLFCLPTGMAEQPSVGTGTVMRPETLRRYAQEAGFREIEILPIEHPFWRFYRLVG